MPRHQDNVAAVEFWREDQKIVAQRFYVAFCLFMSTVQDTYLGRMERERRILNWSATCSYYGLVHGGRLLCFLAHGDFPRSHEKLRGLLHEPQRNR